MGTKTGNSTKKSTVVKMQPKKVAATAAPTKTAKAAKPAKKATDSKFIGKTTGQRVQQFQDGLMKANYKAHLTDAELAKAMRNEFPNAVAFTEAHVAGIRSQYNNGRRSSQEGEKPGKPLPKFDEEGNPTNPRATKASKAAKVAKVGKAVKTAKAKKPPVEEVDEEEVDEEVDETEDEDTDEETDEE